jgi:hypothetical protein
LNDGNDVSFIVGLNTGIVFGLEVGTEDGNKVGFFKVEIRVGKVEGLVAIFVGVKVEIALGS